MQRYFEVLLEQKKAADNGKGKGKPADWWQYLAVILQTDPNDPNKAWNVALKCKFCDAFLSSSNPSRIASTHLMKGGCPKIKGDADIATEVSEAFQKHPVEIGQPQAEVMLSLHATSCAPESLWGQLYRKNRSRLGLLRAEKLVFVSSAAKVKQKDFRSMEEKELELLHMCTSVNEESFGSALADCVLVRDFP
ncbi:TPA: hypothetical protein ACH3X1_005487 [Trebouxia sp. C0004]